MLDFTDPAALKARFAELAGMREDILAVSGPKREERDAILQAAAAEAAPIEDEIKTIEANLFKIDQEAAVIARALGGRTGL